MTLPNLVKNHWFKIAFCIYLFSFLINWYKLPQNLFFGHEQGRDAQAIRDIYTLKHFPLISTKTEVEGFYSPPWYYYIMVIPYGLSGGNPVAGSLAIVLFNSTTAVIMFFFVKDLLKSANWGIVAAIITALSWEFINYARWLINVSPAYPLIALALYMAAKYYKSRKNRYFFLYALFATLATQFQITLIFQFVFVTAIFFALRLFKLPSLKTILLSIFVAAFFMSPLIIFDFRHEHITTKSVLEFIGGKQDHSIIFHPTNALRQYQDQFLKVTKRTLFMVKNIYLQIVFFTLLATGFYLFARNRKNRRDAIFTLPITFMSLGILPFNIGLTQLYEGTGVGAVALTTISLYGFWQRQQTKFLAVVVVLFLFFGWVQNLKYFQRNDEWFFVPEQKVLTYKDQVTLINFMQSDAQIKPYRFESFTFPYLHSEGWQYLHSYFYPAVDNKHAKEVYIAIERGIEPFWEKKWTEDLGESDFVYEKNFGQIRLQKRIIKNPT